MRPPTDVWPTLDILERLAAQRRVTNNHLKKKEVTCTSSGFWPSPVPEPPISYLAASLIRKYGSPRVSSQRQTPCADMVPSCSLRPSFTFGTVMVLTPPFSGAVLPHLESDLQSGCTCFLLPHRAAHLWVFYHLGLTPVGLFPKHGQVPGTVCC